MHMQRFDFGKLQDFRAPPKPVEAYAELKLVEPEAPPAPPPPPTFSEQELEAAKKNAFEEGRQAGIQEGIKQAQHQHEERDASLDHAASALVQQTMDIGTRHAALMHQQCAELKDLVLLIGRKVAGDAIATQPEAAVENLVRDCLAILVRQPEFRLHVHPSLVDEMTQRLHVTISKLRANCSIAVMGDESLAAGEGRLEWKDGSAERNLTALWEQISQKLQSVDFTAIADAALQTDQPTEDNNTTTQTPNEGETL